MVIFHGIYYVQIDDRPISGYGLAYTFIIYISVELMTHSSIIFIQNYNNFRKFEKDPQF